MYLIALIIFLVGKSSIRPSSDYVHCVHAPPNQTTRNPVGIQTFDTTHDLIVPCVCGVCDIQLFFRAPFDLSVCHSMCRYFMRCARISFDHHIHYICDLPLSCHACAFHWLCISCGCVCATRCSRVCFLNGFWVVGNAKNLGPQSSK